MHGKCWEPFPRHWLQRKPLVSDLRAGIHRGTCVTHVPWCMPGSLNRGDRENVPGIPGTRATCYFTYLVRGPCKRRSDITVTYLILAHTEGFSKHCPHDDLGAWRRGQAPRVSGEVTRVWGQKVVQGNGRHLCCVFCKHKHHVGFQSLAPERCSFNLKNSFFKLISRI